MVWSVRGVAIPWLSLRAVLPLDPPGAAVRWIEDRLGECARIVSLLELHCDELAG